MQPTMINQWRPYTCAYDSTQGISWSWQHLPLPVSPLLPPPGPPSASHRQVFDSGADKSSRPSPGPTPRPTRDTGLPRPKAVVTAKDELFGRLCIASVKIDAGANLTEWCIDFRFSGAMVFVAEVTADEDRRAQSFAKEMADGLSEPSIGFSPTNRERGDRVGADWQRKYICRVEGKGNTVIGYREHDQIANLQPVGPAVHQESSAEEIHTAKRLMVYQLEFTQHICGHHKVRFAVPAASSVDLANEREVVPDANYLIDNEVRVVCGNDDGGWGAQLRDKLERSAMLHVLRPHPTDEAFIMFIGDLHDIRPSKKTVPANTWSNTRSLCQGKDGGEDRKDLDWKPIESVDYKYFPKQIRGTSKVLIFWGATKSNRSQNELIKKAAKWHLCEPVVTGKKRDTKAKADMRNRVSEFYGPWPIKRGQINKGAGKKGRGKHY